MIVPDRSLTCWRNGEPSTNTVKSGFGSSSVAFHDSETCRGATSVTATVGFEGTVKSRGVVTEIDEL